MQRRHVREGACQELLDAGEVVWVGSRGAGEADGGGVLREDLVEGGEVFGVLEDGVEVEVVADEGDGGAGGVGCGGCGCVGAGEKGE